MKRWSLALVALVACGGGDASPAERALRGARPADAVALAETLAEIPPDAADAAALVSAAVGPTCACLTDEVKACPDVPVVGDATGVASAAWQRLRFAGAYLAAQHRAANADGKAALVAALAKLRIEISPTAALAGVGVPAASQHEPFARAARYVVIDAGGAVRSGALPVVQLTETGALLVRTPDDIEERSYTELAALTKDVERSIPEAPPPPEAPDDPPGDDGSEESGGPGTPSMLDEDRRWRRQKAELHAAMATSLDKALDAANRPPTWSPPVSAGHVRDDAPIDPASETPGVRALPVPPRWVGGDLRPADTGQALVLVDRDADALRVVEVLPRCPAAA